MDISEEELLNFKVHIFSINIDDWEIREFSVNKCIAINYDKLCGQLESVFPILRGRKFILEWTDDDNQIITIRSDSDTELKIAIEKMISKTNICEFKIVHDERLVYDFSSGCDMSDDSDDSDDYYSGRYSCNGRYGKE